MIIKNTIIRTFIIIVFFSFFSPVFSQDLVYKDKSIGFNVGANVAIGTHFQRFGLNINFFYLNNFFQTNSEIRTYFSFKNLGPKFIYPEIIFAQGVVLGYGAKQSFFNPFITSISNQTGLKNSVAYSYNIYLNKIKTSQVTGIASFQFDKISLIIENDILAKPMLDRYRTGGILIQYQYKDIFQAAINCTMWTGQMGKATPYDHPEIYTKCYMDTTNGIYSNISHGLLSAQFKCNIGLSQSIQTNIGVDAERVRDVVQNKFIHNMKFIPKKWNKANNCHIPMIDEKGNQYLYQTDNKIKKPELYWNIFSNPNIFY
ncbi:MAG: polymorphic toxin type 23 domain-containing protein [Bacteroidota bacterium]|nr:polymorphic toxin type 23 domain-containing protein [Bacteroidota bacterium]MDP3146353.1 polymorphic toxin type 23 domain-containing protein [Bacteroidota bacterium]MDP3556355.1 polymorphic toxin type 23 domain-containing protein [Bacteroidota bacterium]